MHDPEYPDAEPVETEPQRIIAMFRELSRCAIDAAKPRRELRCQWIALGWADPMNESMRKIARDYGETPAAVSKRVADYQRQFRLPDNLFNKSAAASAKYALSNRPRGPSK